MSKLTGKELDTKDKALIAMGYGLSATDVECGYFSDCPNDTKIPATTPVTRELLEAAVMSCQVESEALRWGASSM